jgi:hypothetical protein
MANVRFREIRRGVLLFGLAMTLLAGCTTVYLPDKVELPGATRYPASGFVFTPNTSQGKTDLTLALLAPTFKFANGPAGPDVSSGSGVLISGNPPYETRAYGSKLVNLFFASMQNDFEVALTSSGFRTLGSFADKGDMTYPEREQSDLALQATIMFDVQDETESSESPTRRVNNFQRTNGEEGDDRVLDYYQTAVSPGSVMGQFTAGAFIQLQLLEPLSWEKMWAKTIRIKKPISAHYSYRYNLLEGREIIGEDGRPEVFSQILTALYAQVFSDFQKYFDPKEVSAIAKKGKELRERKRF